MEAELGFQVLSPRTTEGLPLPNSLTVVQNLPWTVGEEGKLDKAVECLVEAEGLKNGVLEDT